VPPKSEEQLSMTDYEKLGVFYLGKLFDQKAQKPKEELLLYESKDMVTHAVCVGMTGSGKTGLCLAILEEAAIDGIPAIVIDPKGDIANLLLTFPNLRSEDFAPWVNEDDARRKGVSAQDFAKQQAELWKKGLADWGQDGERIKRLRAAADFAVYTPGSSAGLPVSIIDSFNASPESSRSDAEAMRDRTTATATSLLSLLGIDADPLRSREHILLSNIFSTAWSKGENLNLQGLIQQIQNPPIQRVGVMELETFFPAKERFALAMQFNNLLATPGFAAWLEGEPLDLQSLMYTKEGKPRIAIFSISHLNDSERMFFVSLLLNQTLAWVRGQPGTTSLRALVYMDEIFGYFPPTANPPSKLPLLTLLKQARAFGVGVMLATQNPVDLDYKGLANAGTWFIGRLQTERDKARVIEGLEGAATGFGKPFDRQAMERTIAGLGNRVFLMNNVHDDAPAIFQVRWAMSYLRGPLTRQQIKTLMQDRKAATTATPGAAKTEPPPLPQKPVGDVGSAAPVLPPEIAQAYVPLRGKAASGNKLVYCPATLGRAKVYYSDTKSGVDCSEELTILAALAADAASATWDEAEDVDLPDSDMDEAATDGASYSALPPSAAKAKSYDAWKKSLADTIYRTRKLTLFRSSALEQVSQVGETEANFRIRLQQAAREQRDAQVEKLKQKFAPKIAALHERIRKAEQAVERESSQASQSKWSTVLSVGSTIVGALFSRKKLSATNISKGATAARSAGRSMKESADVGRAKETVKAMQDQLAQLEADFQEETDKLAERIDPATETLESVTIKPKKTNITVHSVVLAWVPYWKSASGEMTAAWE
jgi:hypothetical protein